jgi:hypothetical protein
MRAFLSGTALPMLASSFQREICSAALAWPARHSSSSLTSISVTGWAAAIQFLSSTPEISRIPAIAELLGGSGPFDERQEHDRLSVNTPLAIHLLFIDV